MSDSFSTDPNAQHPQPQAPLIDRPAPVSAASFAPRSTEQLLHDLQVHQLELELQNEELRNTQYALCVISTPDAKPNICKRAGPLCSIL